MDKPILHDDENKHVIFYGISSEKNIKSKLNNWINIAGKPDIFAEKDGEWQKYPDKLLGKYEVVSIDEALRQFPNANIWVTFSNPGNTPSKLMKKISPENIHFLEANLKYLKGCNKLGRSLHYNDNVIPMCTYGNRKHPSIKTSNTISETLEKWKNFSNKLILANQIDSPNNCFGCPRLDFGFYTETAELKNLRFLQNLSMDACNFKCIYCNATRSGKFLQNKSSKGPTTYDVLKAFSEITEFVDMGKKFTVTFSNGELCVNKYFNEITNLLSHTNWNIELLSNLSVYREELAKLMEAGRITQLITSIDAGTRETFKSIKQNDRFDIVLENIKKYPVNRVKDFNLKYIFLQGVNDNETDVDGFYEIAKESGARIMISTDNNTISKPFTDDIKMREMTLRIIHKSKIDGVKVIPAYNNISKKDSEFITENYNRTEEVPSS